MWKLILPIAIVVLSNCFYHITTKKTPADANAFLSLAVTYSVAAVVSFLIFAFTNHNSTLTNEVKKLNWSSLALGVVIIGLELGYILVYRAGWDVSKAPLIANSCLAIALIFIGMIFFKETITVKQIIGIILCVTGLIVFTI